MKHPFITLLKPSSNNKARKGMKEKSISASASLKTIFAAAAVATVLSLQACMKNTLEEYGYNNDNKSNDISFICKENNGNSNSESNNKGQENDKTTKTAPTTSLTQPIGLFAYKHSTPQMNAWVEQMINNHVIKPIGGGTGKAPII